MKITQEKLEKGKELYHQLVQKAWDSRVFKEQLIFNPEGAIKEMLGNDFNSSINRKIIVEDQSNDSMIYLNIPKKLDLDNIELTESQLEVIAGGGPTYDLGAWYVNTTIDNWIAAADFILNTFERR